MAFSYCRVKRKIKRNIACKQSGSDTGQEMSSTHDSITVDICFASRPLTISVGNGDDGREALLDPVDVFVALPFVALVVLVVLSKDMAFELSLPIDKTSKRLDVPVGSGGGGGFAVFGGGFSNESITGRL